MYLHLVKVLEDNYPEMMKRMFVINGKYPVSRKAGWPGRYINVLRSEGLSAIETTLGTFSEVKGVSFRSKVYLGLSCHDMTQAVENDPGNDQKPAPSFLPYRLKEEVCLK